MGKLKRIVAKLLIASQIYGNVFQGIAHAADLADSYEIRNEIHLHSSMDKHGSLRLALGTDGDDSKDLKWIDIPSYQTAKKLAPQIELGKILEVEDDNLSDGSCGDDNISTDDESSFACDGVTRNSQAAYFTLQGLNFSISNAGVMVISGSQKDRSKPIFLSGESAIILNSLDANALEVMAPRIISRGQSNIERLMLTGLDGSQKSVFINDGELTAKQLFLNNITGDNQGSILAASLGVIGELESSGVIAVDELALEENSVVKLDEDSCADIKNLILSKDSHLQNQQQAENVLNIGVLHSVGSLGGSITNLGTMAISEVAKDSAFQAITNRHFMGLAQGDLKVETFTNSNAFGLEQGSLQVGNGTNSGVLDANGLEVADEFTNTEAGNVTTPTISGAGTFDNLGSLETDSLLELEIKQFANHGLIKSQAMKGSKDLQKFTNAEGASIEVAQTLSFADNTKVINQGKMEAKKAMALFAAQTTQAGEIKTPTLNLFGESEFENEGDIDVEQDLYLALSGFTNKDEAILSTGRIYGYEQLITLKNDSGSLFKVRDGPLALATTTELINAGTIESQSLDLNLDRTTLHKSGIFRSPSINLTGAKPFTNFGEIIANHLRAANELLNHGQLIAQQSASLAQGLTVEQGGFALLYDLKIAGDITNRGELQIVGIQPSQDVIKLTNSGIASFDANQLIPIVKKDQPQNLARIVYEAKPESVKEEQEQKQIIKISIGSKSIKLNGEGSPDLLPIFQSPPTTPTYSNYLIECENFFNKTEAGKAFIKDTGWSRTTSTILEFKKGFSPHKLYSDWYHKNYLVPVQVLETTKGEIESAIKGLKATELAFDNMEAKSVLLGHT